VSFHVLASGALVGDPQRREGSKGPFTTAIIRAVDGDGATLVSVIGFGAEVERLLEFAKGDALAVSGRAKLTAWSARDGTEKRGASVVAAQIAAAKPRPKPAAGSLQCRTSRVRRSSYSASRLHPGPPLPADRVDDLWRDVP
jgi:single-stranded DNA-binding protein